MNGPTMKSRQSGRADLELVRSLVDHGRIQSLAPGEVLLRRGEALEDVFVVISGRLMAKRARRSAAGPRVLEAGDVLGPFEPGMASPSPVRVRAIDASKVIRLSSEQMQTLLAEDLTLGSRLLFEGRKVLEELTRKAASSEGGKVVLAYGPRAGAGTTSGAVLTAALGAQKELATLLVDIHPWFGSAALVCDREPVKDLADLLVSEITPENLEDMVLQKDGGFDLLAAPRSPERGDGLEGEKLRKLLQVATEMYDLVVVDLNAGLDATSLDVLELANEDYEMEVHMYLPATLEGVMAGRQALKVFEFLGIPSEVTRVLFNHYRTAGGVTPEQFRRCLERAAVVVAEDAGQLLKLSNEGRLPEAAEEMSEHPLVRAAETHLRRFLGLIQESDPAIAELYAEERVLLPAPKERAREGWLITRIAAGVCAWFGLGKLLLG